MDPTTNRILSETEESAVDYEDAALRLIRETVDGEWSQFCPPSAAAANIPEYQSLIHLNEDVNVIQDTTPAAVARQDSLIALLFILGGSIRPFMGIFVEQTRRQVGIRKTGFMRFFAELDSVAFDRLEGRQNEAVIEDSSSIQRRVVELHPLISLILSPTGAEHFSTIFEICESMQSAFSARNRSRVERMSAVDSRDSYTTLTRSQLRWANRPVAKAKAAPP